MESYPIAFVLLSFIVLGCKPAAEREKQARLSQFQTQMERRDASVTLGMTRSDVIAALGKPFWTTNVSDPNYQIVDIYNFEPPVLHWGVITNGFEIYFSNNIVVQKSPIKGTMR